MQACACVQLFNFTRSVFETPDRHAPGGILWVDAMAPQPEDVPRMLDTRGDEVLVLAALWFFSRHFSGENLRRPSRRLLHASDRLDHHRRLLAWILYEGLPF